MSGKDKIKDFFKSNVLISEEEIEKVLSFKPDTLIGIDKISGDRLKGHNIATIADLASLHPEKPPKMDEILPQVMSKWIKIGRLVEKAVNEQLKQQKKLIMVGLDNGGKSSILAVLQDKFSIIKDLLPTRGVHREKLDFFGYPIISWDLGGQIQYRENLYFTKPELFFTEVDLVLYVIDTQDSERFSETASYFRQLLKSFEELKEQPAIIVVLNKSDQDVRKTLQWQKNVAAIKNKIELVLSGMEGFSVKYCDTTIFQKETVMQMFSTALSEVSETSEIIEHILEEFALQIEAKAISLISMDGLIFGNYVKSDTDEMLVNNSALLLQALSNFHTSIGLVREKTIELNLPDNDYTIRGEKLFDYSNLQIPVYLWVLTDIMGKSSLEEHIEFFSSQLVPLINLFI